MSVIEFPPKKEVCVVLGVDENGYDQVLSVCSSFESATKALTRIGCNHNYFDLWVERHVLED